MRRGNRDAAGPPWPKWRPERDIPPSLEAVFHPALSSTVEATFRGNDDISLEFVDSFGVEVKGIRIDERECSESCIIM